jgi:hypothetical protein
MLGCHLVNGAGHWVQQEQGEKVSELLVQFLREQDQTDNKLISENPAIRATRSV